MNMTTRPSSGPGSSTGVTRSAYTVEQPRFAADPDVGHLANAPTLEDVVTSACLDLLTILGFILLAREEGEDHVGLLFHPERSPLAREFRESRKETTSGQHSEEGVVVEANRP